MNKTFVFFLILLPGVPGLQKHRLTRMDSLEHKVALIAGWSDQVIGIRNNAWNHDLRADWFEANKLSPKKAA